MATLDRFKNGFFDRGKVQKAVGAANRRVLSGFGAFVRRRAKGLIRKRKRISDPGTPPSSHVGTLRRLIFFAYDFSRQTVVIGPTLFREASIVPRLLEKGGETSRKGRVLRYRARPFMRPAYAIEMRNVPKIWKNSVKA